MDEIQHNDDGFYSVASRAACGGIMVENGIIINAAPYFRFMLGHKLEEYQNKYFRFQKVVDEDGKIQSLKPPEKIK